MESDSDDELMMQLGRICPAPERICRYCTRTGAKTVCSICEETYYCDRSCLRKDSKNHRKFCAKNKLEDELEDEESSDDEREVAVHDSSSKTHEGEKHERRGSKSNTMAERRRSGNIISLNANLPGEVALTGLTASEKSQMLKLARKVAKVEKNQDSKIRQLEEELHELRMKTQDGRDRSASCVGFDPHSAAYLASPSSAAFRRVDKLSTASADVAMSQAATEADLELLKRQMDELRLNMNFSTAVQHQSNLCSPSCQRDSRSNICLSHQPDARSSGARTSGGGQGSWPKQLSRERSGSTCSNSSITSSSSGATARSSASLLMPNTYCGMGDPSRCDSAHGAHCCYPGMAGPFSPSSSYSVPYSPSSSLCSSPIGSQCQPPHQYANYPRMSLPRPLVPAPADYRPLTIREDEKYRKYFKLKDVMLLPAEQIKAKMKEEGVDPDLLDKPDAISPNDPGLPPGTYLPLRVRDDPEYKKYLKLLSMEMPKDMIMRKMEEDGLDAKLLDRPDAISPNDKPPAAPIEPPRIRVSLHGVSGPVPPPMIAFPHSLPSSQPALSVGNDPAFSKYFKLLELGLDQEQVKAKMKMDGHDASLLDRPDAVSPNDQRGLENAHTGPVTMEQLYAMVMHHQRMFQEELGDSGAPAKARRRSLNDRHMYEARLGRSRRNSASSGVPGEKDIESRGQLIESSMSEEDQMKAELEAAEAAIEDLFNDGDGQSGARGTGHATPSQAANGKALSFVDQIARRVRKQENEKIISNRDRLMQLLSEIESQTFSTPESAIAYFEDVSPQVESCGLELGLTHQQTWSARLLIKCRQTGQWYFSEEQRRTAGRAYQKLWSLSVASQLYKQLQSKRIQITNAPQVMREAAQTRVVTLERYTELLKEAVKLRHKIFSGHDFQTEVQRMRDLDIPQALEHEGQLLRDAATTLAHSALDFAEAEIRRYNGTANGKPLLAPAILQIGARAVQLVQIVIKTGAEGVDEKRLKRVEDDLENIRVERGQEDELDDGDIDVV